MKSAASEMQARSLLDDLISMQLDGYCGAAWGYNFDWQSRNFFAPRGTATIVPTAFAARALVEGARAFQVEEYLALARSCCDFILKDLPRPVSTDDQICFSYSPYSDTKIFNASLLAGEVLAEVGVMTGEEQLIDYAERGSATSSSINVMMVRGLMEQIQNKIGWTISTRHLFSFHLSG